MNRYDIVGPHHRVIARDIIPTPRLLSEGTRDYVDAYEYISAGGGTRRPIWRVRDDAFDPEGTVYSKVYVNVVEDW